MQNVLGVGAELSETLFNAATWGDGIHNHVDMEIAGSYHRVSHNTRHFAQQLSNVVWGGHPVCW